MRSRNQGADRRPVERIELRRALDREPRHSAARAEIDDTRGNEICVDLHGTLGAASLCREFRLERIPVTLKGICFVIPADPGLEPGESRNP